MPPPFHFDRTWSFEVTPVEFWSTVSRTEDYRRWWGWLRRFEAEALAENERWTATIQSPLPYALRVALDLKRVEPPNHLDIEVSGDLAGPARLEVAPDGDSGCSVRVWWEVEARSPPLRLGATVARPLLQWSHERVVALGLLQFRRRALGVEP